MNRVTLLIISTLVILVGAIGAVILVARGYRFNLAKKEFFPTGILVATSDPDGAEVFLDGKLKTATNNTISLSPGRYKIRIVKDGFIPWEKEITIKPEEVYKTNVFLFPAVPDLRPLTLTGAVNPALSPDSTKIVYSVASASADKNGVWIADMSRFPAPVPFFSSADFRQIYHDSPILSLSTAKFLWSPDSRQIIATPGSGLAVLLDTDKTNDQLNFIANSLPTILSQWDAQNEIKTSAQKNKLVKPLADFLSTTSANLRFSPDETKILYQATASASLPEVLPTYLPGTNPTPETRQLSSDNIYVYDIKEDRNYEISNCNPPAGGSNCVWFPSSRHLLSYTSQQISVMEYDGTNPALVYAGPFTPGIVFPWPNWSKIVILTSLNSLPSAQENLYTINLR